MMYRVVVVDAQTALCQADGIDLTKGELAWSVPFGARRRSLPKRRRASVLLEPPEKRGLLTLPADAAESGT
jgi:hypothetical protein